MTSVTINKTLTVIETNGLTGKVSTHKLNNFETVLNQYNEVVVSGMINHAKFNKYVAKLKKLGFKVTDVVYHKSMLFDSGLVLNFKYVFNKD